MIEFRILGQVDLKTTGDESGSDSLDPSGLLTQSKPTAVLFYLLLSRPSGFRRRDEIVAMFWPESSQKRSRAALSQVLYVLRRALGPDVIESRGVEEIGIDPDQVRCDAIEFRRAIAERRTEEAMALYGGELLPAFFTSEAVGFERWLDAERAELAGLASSVAWDLAEDYEKQRNAAAAGHWGRRAAALAPYQEASAQRLMEMLARLGDRSGALKAYERFRQAAVTELEIEPSGATKELAERIRESMDGPAREAGAIASSDPASDAADRVSVPMRWSRGLSRPVASVLTLAVAAVLFLGLRSLVGTGPSTAIGEVQPTAITVLPIQVMGTADPSRAEIMTSRLIDALARAGFRMPPYGTVRGFQDSIPAFYRSEPGADWFVQGDLVGADGVSELALRIVDPRTDLVVWSHTTREGGRPMSDFMLEVAQLTADNLAPRMGLETELIPRLTADPIADSLYTRARFLSETNYSNQGFRQAAALYAAAIELDSSFVPAYVGLAIALGQQSRVFWDPPPMEQMETVSGLLGRALELDPSSAEVHAALGWVAYTYEWDWDEAADHFLQAIELDPNSAGTYNMYAFLLLATGSIDEGLKVSRAASEMAPLNPLIVTTNCWHLYLVSRFEEANAVCRRVLDELDPAFLVAAGAPRLASVFMASGHERAETALAMPVTPLDTLPNFEHSQAIWKAIAGDTAAAIALIDSDKNDPKIRPFRVANAYAWAGQLDSAFVWLDRAIEARDPYVPEIAIRPVMEPYRADPRYKQVLRRLKLR
ncbi:MAG: BTAD domain-containing putative transcriptional regulator [Gemmatimonadota bacterium]